MPTDLAREMAALEETVALATERINNSLANLHDSFFAPSEGETCGEIARLRACLDRPKIELAEMRSFLKKS